MKILKLPLLILIGCYMLCSAGCSKSGADCFTSAGEVTLEERILPDFDSLVLNDNVNLILTYDSMPIQTVAVEAGKNLLRGITTEVSNGELIIHNLNVCNWVRSFNKP